MVYLVYRFCEKTGRRFGPYAVRAIRLNGVETPRQEYLGKVVVKEDGTVELKRTGETLGRLGEKNGDVVKVSQSPKPIKTLKDLALVFAEKMRED